MGLHPLSIVVALRKALGLTAKTLPQGAKGHYLTLDRDQRPRLKPDISWWGGPRCVFVGDVKYKKLKSPGLQHPDLHQLLGYLVATGLLEGILIYAAREERAHVNDVVHIDKKLRIVTIDLRVALDAVLQHLFALSDEIQNIGNRVTGKTCCQESRYA